MCTTHSLEQNVKCSSCPTDMSTPSQFQHDVYYCDVNIWLRHSFHSIIILLIPQQIFRETRFGQHEILKKKKRERIHIPEIASG